MRFDRKLSQNNFAFPFAPLWEPKEFPAKAQSRKGKTKAFVDGLVFLRLLK
jgi:hypothetical protein